MSKKLKKEIEGKLEAKIQEVVLEYDPIIGKKLKKSIENASESIAKKAFKYLAKVTEKDTVKPKVSKVKAKKEKTEASEVVPESYSKKSEK